MYKHTVCTAKNIPSNKSTEPQTIFRTMFSFGRHRKSFGGVTKKHQLLTEAFAQLEIFIFTTPLFENEGIRALAAQFWNAPSPCPPKSQVSVVEIAEKEDPEVGRAWAFWIYQVETSVLLFASFAEACAACFEVRGRVAREDVAFQEAAAEVAWVVDA